MDQIPAEKIKTGVGQFAIRSTNLLFLFGIRRNCLRSEGVNRCIRRAVKQTVNYRGISLLPTTRKYKILSNILLSKLTPYADEITGDYQSGFRRTRSTTDDIICGNKMLTRCNRGFYCRS